MSVTAVIPARGGSLGVNRKAMQLVDGVPLVYRAVKLARQVKGVDRVLVTTDSSEVASYCRLRGVEVLDRPAHLAEGSVPLDRVLKHVVASGVSSEIILLLQPTSPLLSPLDLGDAVEQFTQVSESGVGAAYLVYPSPHQYWQDGRRVTPHVNRQQLDPDKMLYRETGARLVTRQHALFGGGTVGVIELGDEASCLDVDSYDDLALVDRHLSKRWVALACVASPELGTGHLYRCLRLADRLRRDHYVTLEVVDYRAKWVDDLLASRGQFPPPETGRWPDLLILDTLDLYDSRIITALQHEVPVVSLENESSVAAKHATAVVNELAAPSPQYANQMFGPRFAVLREEFTDLPSKEAPEEVKRVLLTFGGSDPAHLSARVGNLLHDAPEVRVIQGPAATVGPQIREGLVSLANPHMAEEMHRADLIITSRGRTQYEAAASGTPTITIAANERETRHHGTPGQLHLGLHASLTDSQIQEAVHRVVSSRALRDEMATTAKAQVDGRGVERLVWLVEGILRGL